MVMPLIKDSKTLAAAGADKEDGRTPTIVSAPATAAPELSERPRHRTVTAQDNLRILGEADRAAGVPGGIGAIVRREGLYSSALSDWRRQRAAGAFEALNPARRGPKTVELNPPGGRGQSRPCLFWRIMLERRICVTAADPVLLVESKRSSRNVAHGSNGRTRLGLR